MIKLSVLVTDKTMCSMTAFENKQIRVTKMDEAALLKACESDILDVAFEVTDATIAATLSKLLGREITPVHCMTYFNDFQTVYIVTSSPNDETLELLRCDITSIP